MLSIQLLVGTFYKRMESIIDSAMHINSFKECNFYNQLASL